MRRTGLRRGLPALPPTTAGGVEGHRPRSGRDARPSGAHVDPSDARADADPHATARDPDASTWEADAEHERSVPGVQAQRSSGSPPGRSSLSSAAGAASTGADVPSARAFEAANSSSVSSPCSFSFARRSMCVTT